VLGIGFDAFGTQLGGEPVQIEPREIREQQRLRTFTRRFRHVHRGADEEIGRVHVVAEGGRQEGRTERRLDRSRSHRGFSARGAAGDAERHRVRKHESGHDHRRGRPLAEAPRRHGPTIPHARKFGRKPKLRRRVESRLRTRETREQATVRVEVAGAPAAAGEVTVHRIVLRAGRPTVDHFRPPRSCRSSNPSQPLGAASSDASPR
jgi:hypothetical protein